jgi:predicted alpha-1,2-mannosidase
MKRSYQLCLFALILSCLFAGSANAQSGSLYDAVDPFIGTAGGGNTFPGASLPFGMVQWSPQTSPQGFYYYQQKKIYGFSMVHLSGVGCPIFADVPTMPWTGRLTTSPEADRKTYTVDYDHANEQAHPGYYAVTLGNGVKVELTVDERSGMARLRFPEGQTAGVLVNPGGSADTNTHMAMLPPIGRDKDGTRVEVAADGTVRGTVTTGGVCGSDTRYTIYFAAKFDRPIQHFTTWQDAALQPEVRVAEGKKAGAWLDFGNQREVRMKIGISYVSEANALENLNKEVPGWDFDAQHAKARRVWTAMLNRVQIEGGEPDQRTIFATGLYHSLLSPTTFSDENGDYMGFDRKVHSLAGTKQRAQYANFSDWDIYRDTVQLQALLTGARSGDMMQSLVNDAEQFGWLPKWPAESESIYAMAGDSSTAVLSTVYAFGAHNFDTAAALKYMVKAGTVSDRDLPFGRRYNETAERPHLKEYLKLGYIPTDDPISASRTLEYANDDFAIAQFARHLGDTAVYQRFLRQSANWRNLLDPETHWIRPRYADGHWLEGFDADTSQPRQRANTTSVSTDQVGFEEGNTYQYSFMVPFDYPYLFRQMGGDQAVQARLDKFFTKLRCWGDPCFNMENEPDFVTPYAYTFAGAPWKEQEVMARIEGDTFTTKPDGLAGNDDLGATSDVYVWNALGLYPAVPGVGGLALGSPMFKRATIHFADGRILDVHGEGTGPYVQSVTLNGATYTSTWLPLSKLKAGTSELVFKLSTEPNRERGTTAADRPPSFTE